MASHDDAIKRKHFPRRGDIFVVGGGDKIVLAGIFVVSGKATVMVISLSLVVEETVVVMTICRCWRRKSHHEDILDNGGEKVVMEIVVVPRDSANALRCHNSVVSLDAKYLYERRSGK